MCDIIIGLCCFFVDPCPTLRPNSHRPPDTTKQRCLCRIRRCELSLATVWQSPNSLRMDDIRRVAFSEEV